MFKLREIILNKKNNFIKKYTFFHFCFQNFSTNLYMKSIFSKIKSLKNEESAEFGKYTVFNEKIPHEIECTTRLCGIVYTVIMLLFLASYQRNTNLTYTGSFRNLYNSLLYIFLYALNDLSFFSFNEVSITSERFYS